MEKKIIAFGDEYTYESLSAMEGAFYSDLEHYKNKLIHTVDKIEEAYLTEFQTLKEEMNKYVNNINEIASDIETVQFYIKEWNTLEIKTCYSCRIDTTQIKTDGKYKCTECDNILNENEDIF